MDDFYDDDCYDMDDEEEEEEESENEEKDQNYDDAEDSGNGESQDLKKNTNSKQHSDNDILGGIWLFVLSDKYNFFVSLKKKGKFVLFF